MLLSHFKNRIIIIVLSKKNRAHECYKWLSCLVIVKKGEEEEKWKEGRGE